MRKRCLRVCVEVGSFHGDKGMLNVKWGGGVESGGQCRAVRGQGRRRDGRQATHGDFCIAMEFKMTRTSIDLNDGSQ